jgi:hypothetical protein
LLKGDKTDAAELYRQALAKDWPPDQETSHRESQIAFAEVLAGIGRQREASSVLLAVIEQSGNDAYIGKKAADAVRRIGIQEQVEAAYVALTARFPADSSVWLRLGDVRSSESKEAAALEAYRSAMDANAQDEEAKRSVARMEEILRLDPTPRRLSIRERAQRWDLILQRFLDVDAACAPPEQAERANTLLMSRTTNVATLDRKVEAIRELWNRSAEACHADDVLNHIMAKLSQ